VSAGTIESPYELVKLIGEGGMGQVYLARHKGLDRVEALKVLSPRLAKAKDFVARLRREARAASLLTHPNIVAVYGLGRLDDGRYYLAMEYLAGETLEEMVDRDGPLPDALSLRLLYQLASAMAQAHEQSVVHRDIKPSNIMLVDQESGSPNVKVLDFGLAKIINPNYVDSVRSSVAGSLYGTPGFMAPERVQGVASVPNMDVYSFGCVAYNLITGRAPFVGRPMDVLSAHQSKMPVPPSERCGVNKELEAIVMRCLSKEPEERPQDGSALCKLLESVSGFSAQEAKRRISISASQPVAVATADTLRPAANQSQGTLVDMRVGPALAHTFDISMSSAPANYQKALLSLAQAVVEGGCTDSKLVENFVAVQEVENARLEYTERLIELFEGGEKLEHEFRKQQAALRFALNDLSFEATEGSASADPSQYDARANDITEELMRLEYQFDRSLREIIDAEVTQTAERDALEETLGGQYTSLLHLVDCNIESVSLSPRLEALLLAFQDAKVLYDQWLKQRL
jgi:serine/threonine protein kinase